MKSLARLQTGHVGIFLAHRDNPEVAIAEFVDAFNELLRDGLIRGYGGSNWVLERVQAATDYAQSKGLGPMAAVSNTFSLAEMLDPVWPGCVASADPESRAWLEHTQVPLLAWSSQARGFFTDRASRDDRSNPELVRCWYSRDNFERKRRAGRLADRTGGPADKRCARLCALTALPDLCDNPSETAGRGPRGRGGPRYRADSATAEVAQPGGLRPAGPAGRETSRPATRGPASPLAAQSKYVARAFVPDRHCSGGDLRDLQLAIEPVTLTHHVVLVAHPQHGRRRIAQDNTGEMQV